MAGSPNARERALEMITGGECGAFNPQLPETFKEVEPLIGTMHE